GVDLVSLIALTEATGLPFPTVMAGEAALNNSDKSPAEIAKQTALAYGMGKLYEYLPGKVASKLGIEGQVGTRALGAGLFGGAGAAQTALEGGNTRQVLSQGIAQGALGALGGPHEKETELPRTEPAKTEPVNSEAKAALDSLLESGELSPAQHER